MIDFVPVARSGGKGISITQFDLDDVEKVGLIKLDLLGIRGLTVLGDVAAGIHSWRRKEYASLLDVLDSIPSVDAETSAVVSSGKTIGCFQIESPGMRATLKDIQAHTISDIMAALALYRPGPFKRRSARCICQAAQPARGGHPFTPEPLDPAQRDLRRNPLPGTGAANRSRAGGAFTGRSRPSAQGDEPF